ncbi:hypothetical protein C6P46_003242 [Rhodotorula mucilaginosa]|uniref:Sugar phosphate transporter domain-containing protein n=1 Tax=Rhodotorula mucilaginosa TaxID=5537 RepID=A0A9P7B7K8_RHOMI|nr:hypothetical protein C6P46_003242 [Rhodotorula mucilaginosa]
MAVPVQQLPVRLGDDDASEGEHDSRSSFTIAIPSESTITASERGLPPKATRSWIPKQRRTPILVLAWIALSSSVILNNRYILIDKGFDFPITLTTIHLLFQTIATRVLHRYTQLISGPNPERAEYVPVASSEATEMMEDDSRISHDSFERHSEPSYGPQEWKRYSVEMDRQTWAKRIVPIAVLFSLSLVLSNWAYLYCSVAFIHILKSFAPVAILLAAFAFRTKALLLLGIVIVISTGVGIASYGQVDFSRIGFAIQMTAIVVEATRVTLIQIILAPPPAPKQGEVAPAPLAPALATGMSPLKSLYFFAPAGLAVNLVFLVAIEGLPALRALPRLGVFQIIGNASLTFALNLSSIMLIGISAMVIGFAKIFKDVLMVILPVALLGESLSALQFGGYAIATAGLAAYKVFG